MDTRPSPIDRLMDTLTDPGPPPAAPAAPAAGLPEYVPFAFPGVPSVGCPVGATLGATLGSTQCTRAPCPRAAE